MIQVYTEARRMLSLAAATATPTPSPSSGPGGGGYTFTPSGDGVNNLQVLIGWACWGIAGVALGTLIGLGTMFVLNHQDGQQQNIKSLGKWALGAVIAGSAGSLGGRFIGFNLFTSNPQAIPGLTGVQNVLGTLSWFAIAACIVGILLLALNLMTRHRNGEPLGEKLFYVMGGCLLVGGASGIVEALLP